MTEFLGTPRYQLVRQLGAGGMGIVYEVLDRDQGHRRVALKVLQRRDAESLMRLKREFRALADARHPNLVSLYELTADDTTCFFTLELVDGVDLLSWVRPSGPRGAPDAKTGEIDVTVRTPSGRGVVDQGRVVEVFRQLAEGVAALHAMGHLHRDLKPSNVMVTAQGRVVILDFGLVADVTGADRSLSELQGHSIVGTAAYMAPEQASVGQLSAAADWYSFGVMLFQALSGRVPFEGQALQVMLEKQQRPAPTLFELAPEADPSLGALCAALLRQVHHERPSASAVLEQLGARAQQPAPRSESPVLGREGERATLRALFEEVRAGGGTRVVRVLGESGIGKTTLIRQWLSEAEAAGAVTLSGRCSERESVPFKALDDIVDALARYLGSLPPERADALMPREAHALARMFPVLQRVSAFALAPVREVRDLGEQRRRAIGALRELLSRMADRKPVVAFIDDVQWGDVDSEEVLNEVLRAPDAPALLLVVAARARENAVSSLRTPMVDLELGPLPHAVCTELAGQLVKGERAEALARESQGNPFLLLQLARFGASAPMTLAQMTQLRLAELSDAERRLIEVTSVAAGPLPEAVALEAAHVAPSEHDTVRALKSARLLRSTNTDRLEMWHDRLRQAVLAGLAPERTVGLHKSIAEALERLSNPGQPEIELTAWHLAGAGMGERAADATLRSAVKARAHLAFDRAATLYERALTQLPQGDARRHSTLVAWGDALSFAGRGVEAAAAYRQAWSVHPSGQAEASPSALELRRRAAEQLLRAGHVDEGLKTIREVLKEVGMTLAPTPWRALAALAFRRLHVRLRGLAYTPRGVTEVRPSDLARIDVCWSVSVGLAMVDTIRGASFQTRQLLLALDAGEPFRVARALAAEAAFVATDGLRSKAHARGLIDRARNIAQHGGGEDGLLGLIDFCDGLTHFLVGEWAQAQALSTRAERQFSDIGAPVSWEAASARLFSVWSLFYLGEIAELSRRIPALLREAEARGDLYAVTSLKSGLSNVSLLAAGDPSGARAAVREVMQRWSATSFHFQHYWALLSEGLIDLYERTPAEGWARLEAGWPALKGSQLLRIQNVRIEASFLRARLALATGRLDVAAKALRLLEREDIGWARGFALLIRAAAAPQPGELLSQALTCFDQEGMGLFAAATRLRLSATQEVPLRDANARAATAWMAAQGIVDPERMTAVLIPTLASRALGAGR